MPYVNIPADALPDDPNAVAETLRGLGVAEDAVAAFLGSAYGDAAESAEAPTPDARPGLGEGQMYRSDFEALSPARRAAFMSDGGRLVDDPED
jgi:hypothetical protein